MASATQMTAADLKALCKERKLYQTPSLNERLYANARGFTSLGGLEEYTALKALFLDANALESLEGLPPLPHLKCLFLQGNQLTSLNPQVLAGLPALDTLNISGNALSSLDGLQACTALHTLTASDNRLGSVETLSALAGCSSLESLDLQNNQLGEKDGEIEGEALLALLRRLPALKCLYLRGNPLVGAMRCYRKATIAAVPGLTYLDDRPVFETERRCAEAWARGGLEAEREERARCLADKEEAERASFAALQAVRAEGFRKRRAVLGLPPGDTDPFFDTLPPGWEKQYEQASADGQQETEDEPPELVAARQRLAAVRAAAADDGSAGQGETASHGGEDELPPLSEADVQAVLEESRQHREEMLAEAAAAVAAGAAGAADVASPRAENCAPNSSNGSGGSCTGCAAEAMAGQASGAAAAVELESDMDALD